jgi:transcriptional regulator with XRE-family HTH domain
VKLNFQLLSSFLCGNWMDRYEEKLAKKIGKNISNARQAKGLTLEKLAYENDISKGYLSNLENGNRLPSLSMLLRISRILGLEPKDFM